MRRSEVVRVYKFIRKEFFPRWDKKNEWTIVLCEDLPLTGRCNLKMKCIEIQSKSAIEMGLPLFFIHEISHAVSHEAHNKKWKVRMGRAAYKADGIDKELAQRIREDVTSYDPSSLETISVGGICGKIEEIILESEREISFPKLINWIARWSGEYPQEFKTYYRKSMGRFRKAFDEARDFKMTIRKKRNEKGIVIS